MSPSLPWTLDQLKSALSRDARIKGWILSQEHVHRRERYFLSDHSRLAIDQDRETRSQSISARILVHIGRKGRQGEIIKKLFPALPLQPQLDAAVGAASQTDHQSWELPVTPPAHIPSGLKSADPRMAEDLEASVARMTREIELSVGKKRDTEFNSAELFLSVHDRETHLSNGLIHRASQSRVYVEAAYSMSRKLPSGEILSDEYLNTAWGVSPNDLSIQNLFDETSERAEHSLNVKKPLSGKYAVLVDAEVLGVLLNNQVELLTGAHSYNRLPFISPGSPLIEGASADLLTITLDPSIDFGADTCAVSDQGTVQTPLKLVERNRVLATASDKQHSDYLGIPVTTARGNVVVEGGSLTHAELTRQAPQVLEILQFSGLFADVNSGTFSSEIRLARLYDNATGQVSWIKGGSLSGSISENFKSVRLSRETQKRAHFDAGSSRGKGYLGPSYALLNDVSIVS